MKRKNINTLRTYEKNGEVKKIWLPVGTLTELDDGKMFIELNMFPNTNFYIFEQDNKGNKQQVTEDKPHDEELPSIDLNEDLPF